MVKINDDEKEKLINDSDKLNDEVYDEENDFLDEFFIVFKKLKDNKNNGEDEEDIL